MGPILATCVVAIVYSAVYAYALRGHVRFAFDWDLARRTLAFGLPEIPLRWGSWALKVSDRLILQRFTALSAVGIYSVGYAIGKMPFELVANGIHWAIVPFFYATATEESDARSKRIFAEVATWNVVVLAGLGLATVVFAGGSPGPARHVEVRGGPGGHSRSWSSPPSWKRCSTFRAKESILKRKTQYLLPLFLVPAAINVGLNFALIPAFGMMGAAWSRVVGDGIMVGLTLAVSQRIYPIPYEYGRIGQGRARRRAPGRSGARGPGRAPAPETRREAGPGRPLPRPHLRPRRSRRAPVRARARPLGRVVAAPLGSRSGVK